jgi:HJR/Mrr/RecB family endonuclease
MSRISSAGSLATKGFYRCANCTVVANNYFIASANELAKANGI